MVQVNAGINNSETSRDISICGHVINQDDLSIVNDTLTDDRFSENPLVTEDPHVRFYAGYPVYSENKLKVVRSALLNCTQAYDTSDLARLKIWPR